MCKGFVRTSFLRSAIAAFAALFVAAAGFAGALFAAAFPPPGALEAVEPAVAALPFEEASVNASKIDLPPFLRFLLVVASLGVDTPADSVGVPASAGSWPFTFFEMGDCTAGDPPAPEFSR